MDKSKYNFTFMVTPHHQNLIWQCVELMDILKIRICKSLKFGYLVNDRNKLGLCSPSLHEKEGFFIIRLNEAINNDKTFVETVIHELLHTITDSQGHRLGHKHRGTWKEVATYVNQNTPFNITTTSSETGILTYLSGYRS